VVDYGHIVKESPIKGKGLELTYTTLSPHVKRVKHKHMLLPALTQDVLDVLTETLEKVRGGGEEGPRKVAHDFLLTLSDSRFCFAWQARNI
jgi:hypothetical protein